jgi:hypothetical protein
MKRFEDWPRRLAAAIEAARGRPFCWGEHDCLLFAADVVHAITGLDPAASWRGRYDSRAAAAHHLSELGGLEAVVTGALGTPLSHPTLAQRGDVVMVDTNEGPALGVCNGANAACAGPEGLTFKPMPVWRLAWRV